jgi:transposase InsO family protein
MQIKNGLVPKYFRLSKIPDVSRVAKLRLDWFDFYRAHDNNAALTCRHFAISRKTFYKWKRVYDPKHLWSLEDRSRRPRHTRQPTWSLQLVQAVLKLREERPRWGKVKLALLLRQQGLEVSTSMVGRIMKSLKARGLLREPSPNGVSVRRRPKHRLYAMRKPKEYQARLPGDLVQVDTLDIRPLPGVILKQFTARDVISRWDVLEAHTRATANTAAGFLENLLKRMPFMVRAIQVDGGSEFHAEFELACQQKKIRLFVLPPHSPKLNGCVERANRTHTEEFYEVEDFPMEIAALNQSLLNWEHVYNTIRPHQSLGYLTPQQYLLKFAQKKGA